MKNIKPRIIDYIFMGLAVLCFLFTLIYGCVKLPQLPDLLPSHYNFAGEIDGWSGKAGAVSAPMVIGCVPAYKLPRLIRATRTMMSLMLLSSEAFMAYTLLCSVRLSPLHPAATPIYFVLIGVPIVVVLVETFRK